MKDGAGELGGEVQVMFVTEFAKTIGDADAAAASEIFFAEVEITGEQISFGDELGKGAFGVVKRGRLTGTNRGGIDLVRSLP
jgi:hypothetical protein